MIKERIIITVRRRLCAASILFYSVITQLVWVTSAVTCLVPCIFSKTQTLCNQLQCSINQVTRGVRQRQSGSVFRSKSKTLKQKCMDGNCSTFFLWQRNKLPFHSSDFFLNSEKKKVELWDKTQNYGFFCFLMKWSIKKVFATFHLTILTFIHLYL